jgi:hypothetical protein
MEQGEEVAACREIKATNEILYPNRKHRRLSKCGGPSLGVVCSRWLVEVS